MAIEHPTVIVLAGPNGSGKTTAAPKLLPGVLGVVEFVNADDRRRRKNDRFTHRRCDKMAGSLGNSVK